MIGKQFDVKSPYWTSYAGPMSVAGDAELDKDSMLSSQNLFTGGPSPIAGPSVADVGDGALVSISK